MEDDEQSDDQTKTTASDPLAQGKPARTMSALRAPPVDHRCPAELARWRKALEEKGAVLKPAEAFLELARSRSARGGFVSHRCGPHSGPED
jgi:hypothetical protein